MVAKRQADLYARIQPVLFPLEISIDNTQETFTRLKVVSEDTPAFLYALSNALSLRGISIEHVRITTRHNQVEDLIDFVDERGHKITDSVVLDQVKLSVLLTKQFTGFLGQAPDPCAALSRFEKMVENLISLPQSGQWVKMLSNPRILQDLARLLGASDFLWEDIIRVQYETLLPMLGPQVEGRRFAAPWQTIPERMEKALIGARDLETQRERLNEFKDQEIFLIDLDHILTPGVDFMILAEHLTRLAEAVVNRTMRLNYHHLAGKYGRPRTVAGMEAEYAVLGLGKFGGADLGYASDIELLFVYSDNGRTDGEESIDNSEFYDRLVKAAIKFIQAKREGIFNIDLRLRPHGEDGPLACSLEAFCGYYGPGGTAHAYERLALVRLRAVGGDAELGARVERLRDEFVYTVKNIDFPALRELRARQLEEKTQGHKLNAKFSPGALVDLEYDVQILQVMYGKEYIYLRTPRIQEALQELPQAGVLSTEESGALIAAYGFLRNLINGLRMLRGSARDLFLPPLGSNEYTHLARRLGYEPTRDMDPAQQLHLEFETRTADIRAFIERHFGRDSLPGPEIGNAADLILSDKISPELRRKILGEAGFMFPEQAYENLRRMAGEAGRRLLLAKLAVLACDMFRRQPDPDMALNNWERFVRVLPDPAKHFKNLLSQPKRLEILLSIFSSSQFLADSLVRNPEFLETATDPRKIYLIRERAEHALALERMGRLTTETPEWLNGIRCYRRQEFLRIATRDICLHVLLPEITLELSNLAEALIQAALDRVWFQMRQNGNVRMPEGDETVQRFCVLAFGKLGGSELNYSSDIDLVGICDDHIGGETSGYINNLGWDPFARVMEMLRSQLSQYTDEGYVYRVDLRLRPYGIEGELVPSLPSLVKYYRESATLSELQALLKIRPVAGNLELGLKFIEQIRPLLLQSRERKSIIQSVEKNRAFARKQSTQRLVSIMDVKSGLGGLRDIEFMTQGLQLIHASRGADILEGNTLRALAVLAREKILPDEIVLKLKENYVFLRKIEHYLQILEDRQTHTLPQEKSELTALAKRLLGPEANADRFLEDLHRCLQSVREVYAAYFCGHTREN
jgi:glutamate-ammonia-ligase adenylyltransferase